MHIPQFENKNIPIVDIDDSKVPLNYFILLNLKKINHLNIKFLIMRLVLFQLQVVSILK